MKGLRAKKNKTLYTWNESHVNKMYCPCDLVSKCLEAIIRKQPMQTVTLNIAVYQLCMKAFKALQTNTGIFS